MAPHPPTSVSPPPAVLQRAINCDKAKMERFLPPGAGQLVTATLYAPVSFAPMPVLVFRRAPLPLHPSATGSAAAVDDVATAAAIAPLYRAPDSMDAVSAAATTSLTLVATGTVGCACGACISRSPPLLDAPSARAGAVAGADPDRLIVKRIVLSGFPMRVKQRHAMVRYMFFGPEDVEWFRPIELYTKHGCVHAPVCVMQGGGARQSVAGVGLPDPATTPLAPAARSLVGHIREPVGTHGHMKARFDGAIKQHDTVCMALYKRVFPRWGACFKAAHGVQVSGGGRVDMLPLLVAPRREVCSNVMQSWRALFAPALCRTTATHRRRFLAARGREAC